MSEALFYLTPFIPRVTELLYLPSSSVGVCFKLGATLSHLLGDEGTLDFLCGWTRRRTCVLVVWSEDSPARFCLTRITDTRFVKTETWKLSEEWTPPVLLGKLVCALVCYFGLDDSCVKIKIHRPAHNTFPPTPSKCDYLVFRDSVVCSLETHCWFVFSCFFGC